MMKKRIILISLVTPTYNNVRAASALPYHLIKGYGDAAQFMIYSFNINKIDAQGIKRTEEELGVKIHLLPHPRWIDWMVRLHLLIIRVFLKYPLASYYILSDQVVDAIKMENPTEIWIYGEDIAGFAIHFKGIPCIATMPDCESMFYYRLLRKRFATHRLSQTLRYSLAYHQYRAMEHDKWVDGVKYHFVGKEDALFFKEINPEAEVLFLRHPLYDYKPKNIDFRHPKIKVLIAGRNDIYMAEASDELTMALLARQTSDDGDFTTKHLEFTFLGKGWESIVSQLQTAGYKVSHLTFAENYIEELQKHDVQLTPISVGTGTKGKVLDAIANGLLEIGTPGALENIAVRHGESAFVYENAAQAVKYLEEACRQPEIYERITRNGMASVHKLHDSRLVAQQLFG